MLLSLIELLVYVLVFALVGYGVWWVCVRFNMPPPVLWVMGALLLIFLLLFLGSRITGLGTGAGHFRLGL